MTTIKLAVPNFLIDFIKRTWIADLEKLETVVGWHDDFVKKFGLPNLFDKAFNPKLIQRLHGVLIVVALHAFVEVLLSRSALGMGLARYFHETDKRALMKDCKAKARRVIAKLITVPHHILMVAIAYRAFFEDSASSLRAPFRPTPLSSFCVLWWTGHMAWSVLHGLRHGVEGGSASLVQTAFSLAISSFALLHGAWHWLLPMASIWVFFSPLLHVGDVVEALYLSANSSLSAVSFACSALFYWISLSYGWLATSTTAKAVGAFLSRQGSWKNLVDPKGASAWLTVGLHLVRVGSILSLLLAHAWLGVYLFRMGQPLVGLGPESVQEEAKDLKRFVKGSAQRAEQAAKSKDD